MRKSEPWCPRRYGKLLCANAAVASSVARHNDMSLSVGLDFGSCRPTWAFIPGITEGTLATTAACMIPIATVPIPVADGTGGHLLRRPVDRPIVALSPRTSVFKRSGKPVFASRKKRGQIKKSGATFLISFETGSGPGKKKTATHISLWRACQCHPTKPPGVTVTSLFHDFVNKALGRWFSVVLGQRSRKKAAESAGPVSLQPGRRAGPRRKRRFAQLAAEIAVITVNPAK